jgi:hypothetical protein
MDKAKIKQLKTVLNSRAEKREALLKTPAIQKILRELSVNILRGNVALTPTQKRKLKTHASKVRQLACKKTSLRKRYRISQSGGFLAALAAPLLIPLVKSLLT